LACNEGVTSHALYRHLEHRFDGEIPDQLRRVALAGSAARQAALAARANSRCCDRLALAAARAAAGRGSASDPSAAGNLAGWRAEGLSWLALID
jgi:hypothetical protein